MPMSEKRSGGSKQGGPGWPHNLRRSQPRSTGKQRAALFGLLGLSTSPEARGKHHAAGGEKKKGQQKHKPHKIGLTSAESDPFTGHQHTPPRRCHLLQPPQFR